MGRLLVLFFMLPWWAYIPASIGVIWAGERVYEQAQVSEARRAAALETARPDPVDLAAFDPARDIHVGDEVNVLGRINHDLDYELVKHTNGVPTTTRHLYMIFGATDPADATMVRAALMLDKGEEARFVASKADEWTIDMNGPGWVYGFNGFAKTSVTLDEMAVDAIAEKGLTMAEDFIYIAPFFDGREAALAPPGKAGQTRQIVWVAAALVALIGVVKRVLAVRRRGARDTAAAAPAVASATEPSADLDPPDPSSPPLADTVAPNSPLGRIARRGSRAARAPEPSTAKGELDPVTAGLGYAPLGAREAAMARLSGQPAAALRAGAKDDAARLVFDQGRKEAAASAPTARHDDAAGKTAPEKTSALGFYFWLGLGMLAVGTLAYRPALIDAALPFAVVAVFWLGVYFAFRSFRKRVRARARSRWCCGATAPRACSPCRAVSAATGSTFPDRPSRRASAG